MKHMHVKHGKNKSKHECSVLVQLYSFVVNETVFSSEKENETQLTKLFFFFFFCLFLCQTQYFLIISINNCIFTFVNKL